MIEKQFQDVLQIINTKLKDTNISWVITGSLGMALQGVDIEVNDIDIQTTSDGAYEIEIQLSEFTVVPVSYSTSDQIRSHLGKCIIKGVQVEIMGGIQKRISHNKWEDPVNIKNYRLWINCENMSIPVLSLEYEYQAYLILGRIDKAEKLKSWIS